MDDEAFARMLQQQLLDEERMLMEQEQLMQQEKHPPPPQDYSPHAHHNPPGGYSEYSYGQSHSAPPQQSGFYPHDYGRGLQQQVIPNDCGRGSGASRDPRSHKPLHNSKSPIDPRRGSNPTQQAHNHSNPPQYQYYPAVPPEDALHYPNSAQYHDHDEDADMALARRMQEIEAIGAGYDHQPPTAQPNAINEYLPYYSTEGPHKGARSQEEFDARLARLLAETGQSFRELDLQRMGGNQQAPPPVSSSPMLGRPVGQTTPHPPSDRSPKTPHSCTEAPDAAQTASNPMERRYGGGLSQADHVNRSRPLEISLNSQASEGQPPQQEFTPPAPPTYTPQLPPHYSPQVHGRNQTVASRSPYAIRGGVRVPPGRASVPTPPLAPSSSPHNSAHLLLDPVPLDQGPLQTCGVPTRPQQQGSEGRVSNHSTSPWRNRDPVNPGMRPTSLSEPPMMPGGAFLDVPVPTKKDKQKKKGLLGMFGRSGGKNPDISPVPGTPKSPLTPRSTSRSDGRGMFGGTNKGPTPPWLSTENTDPYSTEEVRNNASRIPGNANGVEQGVVRFKIPDPVPRPEDTIGASQGPLPYSLTVSRGAPDLPEATVGRQPLVSLSRNAAICAVCNETALNPLPALDKKFHSDCFRCITCFQLIDPSGPFAFVINDGDKQPMHRKCYVEIFGIKCCVCKESIPAGADGKVSFVKHPFFDTEQMCPKHARSMTRRCTGCHRFEPENDPFADLNDVGRCVCMACCRSVVVDSHDAQPLWGKVVEFFEKKLNLPVWKGLREVPIVVVGYNALNDQMKNSNNVHGGASQIMTRGLCLTEHESGRSFRMNRMKFDKEHRSFVANDAEARGFTFFQVPDASKSNSDASVTAILCLSGLPQDLSASVLAHEATHAWIKLHPRFDFERPIPPQVEEGCAQLIALLFLNEGLDPPAPLENHDGSGPSDEKLRQYFKFSIETDDHEIYGTGYRRAALAYSKIGIEALMSHIVLYQNFPEV